MGKDFNSWVHQQCPPREAPNLNCGTFVPNSAWQNVLPNDAKQLHLVSNEIRSGYARNGLSQVKTGLPNGPADWFYGLPRYRQALTPTLNSVPKEFNAYPEGYNNAATDAVPLPIEKKFVVFDRSGNQTRLIFSPGAAYSSHCDNVTTSGAVDCSGFEVVGSTASPLCDGLISSDGLDATGESQEAGDESEMREDTEELNALLYSDEDEDEYGCECGCEEEVSTGHSPSKVATHFKLEEEVASSSGSHHHLKRKRSPDGDCSMSELMDTASSGKPNEYQSWECEDEDDAESSCGESTTRGGDSGSSPFHKRLKKDKIRETVKILQSIIPCGKGKDSMYVLDEAIQYLKSLKLKAQSLEDSLDQ